MWKGEVRVRSRSLSWGLIMNVHQNFHILLVICEVYHRLGEKQDKFFFSVFWGLFITLLALPLLFLTITVPLCSKRPSFPFP